jgi:cytochrome c oxidase subunit 2
MSPHISIHCARAAAGLALAAALPLGGCGPALPEQAPHGLRERVDSALMWIQSALVPHGPDAGAVATLSWVMFSGGALILLLVGVLAALAIALPPERRRWMTRRGFIIGLGIVFPVATLTVLLVYGLTTTRDLLATGRILRIEVVGERFWWRVHYLDGRGETQLTSANEIRIPVGQPIEFVLKSNDVIHSFWVPSLAGKLDMIPGRTNVTRFAADRPGIYRGQCAEFCGAQHALMAFYVVAMPLDAFEAWYAAEVQPAREPTVALLAEGRDLFHRNGCGACHVVRGTTADGRLGPDLTHVGGRLSIAAGTFPTSVGTLAGWISSSQHLKPDNLMPSFGNLEGRELRAIAAYLESLK